MSIGTDTKFPEHITIPEALKVPDGSVFKFVLYGIGVIEYKFNESDSTWGLFKAEEFFYNNPQDVSFNPSSMVASFAGSALDQHGKVLEGVVKSLLPGDTSLITGKPLALDLHPKLKTIRGSLGQIDSSEGTTLSDITYTQNFLSGSERDPPAGSHPDGYICRIPFACTHLFYKSA